MEGFGMADKMVALQNGSRHAQDFPLNSWVVMWMKYKLDLLGHLNLGGFLWHGQVHLLWVPEMYTVYQHRDVIPVGQL